MRVPEKWTSGFLVVISIVRASMGAYSALSGPTLLYLASNVEADVYKISTMFTGRSIGTLIGSISAGVIKRFTGHSVKELHLLGFAIGILGLTELVVPWIENFSFLIADVIVGGIVFGYLDAGIQAVILRLWGERSSRSFVQVNHLSYSVGAFLMPFVANPFLAMTNEATTTQDCPSSSNPMTTTPAIWNATTTSSTPWVGFDPVGWTYVIVACVMAVAALLVMALSSFNVEERILERSIENEFISEERCDEPIKDVLFLFLLVVGYYFCCTTSENIYYNYIYSIALCSDLEFTVSQASRLTSLFWLGFGMGRGTGVFVAKMMQPKTIIALSILGTIVDMVLMVVLGQHIAWMPWIVTVSHGFTTSMLYPSGVSLVSQMTNISGRYMFICNVGNACGSLSMLLLAGYPFDNVSPFSVMYLILGLSALNAAFFAALLLAGKSRLQLPATYNYSLLSDDNQDREDSVSNPKTEARIVSPIYHHQVT